MLNIPTIMMIAIIKKFSKYVDGHSIAVYFMLVYTHNFVRYFFFFNFFYTFSLIDPIICNGNSYGYCTLPQDKKSRLCSFNTAECTAKCISIKNDNNNCVTMNK